MKTMTSTVQIGELLLRPGKFRQSAGAGLKIRQRVVVRAGREVGDSQWEAKIRYQSTPGYVEPQKPKASAKGLIFA